MTPTSRLRQALARNRRQPVAKMAESALFALERINVSSRNVQPVFRGIYRWGGFLIFTRGAALACVLLAIVGFAAGVRLWPDAERVVSGFGKSPLMAVIFVKLLFLLTVGAHPLVHRLAPLHHGRRLPQVRFPFLPRFLPAFFLD